MGQVSALRHPSEQCCVSGSSVASVVVSSQTERMGPVVWKFQTRQMGTLGHRNTAGSEKGVAEGEGEDAGLTMDSSLCSVGYNPREIRCGELRGK